MAPIDGVYGSPSYVPTASIDAAVDRPTPQESTLKQFADNRGLDYESLVQANPQINRNNLNPLMEIHIPQECQVQQLPTQARDTRFAGPPHQRGKSHPAPRENGDTLTANVMKGLFSLDYSKTCGGRPCVTDDQIYKDADASRQADMEHDKGAAAERLDNARGKFLDDQPSAYRDNIDKALTKVTADNPQLRMAYYRYYHEHPLKADPDEKLGETNYGKTSINPDVLGLRPKENIKTSDPLSLLGSTMIHEFVHTSQGGGANAVEAASLEAKAYGIEMFFAERLGDDKRVDFISDRYSSSKPDPLDTAVNGQRILYQNHDAMKALYDVIDKGESSKSALQGVSADEARSLSVELISKSAEDYSPKLKALMAEVGR